MHDAYPMNQSSYTPVIANISYEREEEKETDQGMDATSVDNSELFHKHEKLDPDFFDFKLYKTTNSELERNLVEPIEAKMRSPKRGGLEILRELTTPQKY